MTPALFGCKQSRRSKLIFARFGAMLPVKRPFGKQSVHLARRFSKHVVFRKPTAKTPATQNSVAVATTTTMTPISTISDFAMVVEAEAAVTEQTAVHHHRPPFPSNLPVPAMARVHAAARRNQFLTFDPNPLLPADGTPPTVCPLLLVPLILTWYALTSPHPLLTFSVHRHNIAIN